VLIDHRRVPFLTRIVQQLEKELNARLGIAEADITSTRELNDTEKQSLEAQVAKVTGNKVRARYALDKALLGGAVIRVGSTIYDGSVQGQLARIKEAISS
jgi:F-type H+-transporting ATPase subunit delta